MNINVNLEKLSVLHGESLKFDLDDLNKILNINFDKYSHKKAIIFGLQEINYLDLKNKVLSLSKKLLKFELSIEEPIAILLEPSIENIIAQLAILNIGATCVPLDINQPNLRLGKMIESLDIKVIIKKENCKNKLVAENHVYIDNVDEFVGINNGLVELKSDHRTHILHTSGTTGTPKAVQIQANGLLRLAFNTEFSPIYESDVVAHISNTTFDASLFEIYGALLNGAKLCILPKQIILDSYSFKDSIQKYKIDVMAITTALFNLIGTADPATFTGLRTVIVGGEAANAYIMRDVLLHSGILNLRNGYGPTECTTYASSRHVTLEYLDNKSIVDIGSPISNTHIYILNEHQQVVPVGETGEIYISGDGVARSYFNNDEENFKKFITIDIFGHQINMYRTGDIGYITQDQHVEYLGRKDNQIKIRGHRINLEEIENEILNTQLIKSVVIDFIKPEDINKEAYLKAFIVPSNENFNMDQFKNNLEQILPIYMLPRISIVPYIPLNPNGKADKKQLHEFEKINNIFQDQNESEILVSLKGIWKDLLDYNHIKNEDNFFDLGGSSLQVATLVMEIEKKYQIKLPIITLYDYATVAQLAKLIEGKQAKIDSQYIDNTIDILKKDSEIALPSFDQNFKKIDWLSSDEGQVFVTGVTGFLGAFFLADLCELEHVKKVYFLVRAKNHDDGFQRIRENLVKYDMWHENYIDKIVVLTGYLDQVKFGLTDSIYQNLCTHISVIFHLGAHVNYIQPYSIHKPANVIGTLNILQFSIEGRVKPLHYISSIAAYGPTGFFNGTKILLENDDLDLHLNCLKYDTGYSQSQWVAEKIITRAQNLGLPINIFRPGFIMGDSHKGIGNEKDFVARFIKGCLLISAFPKLENQKKEFIAVDYVSSTLLNISSQMNHYGEAYNLVPLDHQSSISLIDLYHYLDDLDYPLDLLDYSSWINKLETSENLDSNPLLPLLPMLKESVYGSLSRWEVYENMPIYSTDNVKAKLGQDIESPTLNKSILDKYLSYWKASGFLS